MEWARWTSALSCWWRSSCSPRRCWRASFRRGGRRESSPWWHCATSEGIMHTLLQQIRVSLRVIRKSPGFAVVAILVLALGIGANTAIFSVVSAALLRPLPFPDAEKMVQVWHVPPPKSFPGMNMFAESAANYLDWEKQNHVFDKMAI